MYSIKGRIYSDAGHILRGKNKIGFSFEGNEGDFTEVALVTSDLTYDGNVATFNNGMFSWRYATNSTYPLLKKDLIEKRYSNDDQIAIILNKDDSEEDMLAFTKMQEWREWASTVAHQIMAKIEEHNLELQNQESAEPLEEDEVSQ